MGMQGHRSQILQEKIFQIVCLTYGCSDILDEPWILLVSHELVLLAI